MELEIEWGLFYATNTAFYMTPNRTKVYSLLISKIQRHLEGLK